MQEYIPPIEKLEWLPLPYEILELADGESITIRILDWVIGKIEIIPRYPAAPPRKVIPCLRVSIDPKYKPYAPYYYDITSKRLIALLIPILIKPDYTQLEITITAVGVMPKKWFEVQTKKIE